MSKKAVSIKPSTINSVASALVPALVKTVTDNAPTVIRKADDVAKFLQWGADDKPVLLAGSNVTALEIGGLCADFANKAASMTVRACNTLALARMLPPVETPRADGKGTFQRKAYDIASEYARKECKTTSAWNNVQGMFRSIEVGEKLKLNAFKVKNGIGYLNAMNFLKDDGTLKDGAEKDAGVKFLFDASVGNNALVERLNEVKKMHNEAAKSDGKPLPFPGLETKEEKKRLEAEAAAKAVKSDTADAINRDIFSLVGRLDALYGKLPADGMAKGRDVIRAICADNGRKLGVMLGLIK